MRTSVRALAAPFLLLCLLSGVVTAATPDRAVTRAIRQELVKQAVPERFRSPRDRKPVIVSAEAAALMISPGDHVYMPVGHMVSQEMEAALMKRRDQGVYTAQKPLHIVGLTNTLSKKFFDREGRIRALSVFNGNSNRDSVSRGHGKFVPIHYSRVPELIRRGRIPVDKAIFLVSPPDAQGFVTIGTSTDASLAALSHAKLAIAEVNPNVPRTRGASRVHISHFDVIVDGSKPLRVIPKETPGDVEEQIALRVEKLIPNDATLQFGIGAIPNGVAARLARSGKRFRVWSEMISDGVVDLVEAGAVKGPVIYGFAYGSKAMLDALHEDRRYQAMPVDVVNSPQILPRMSRLVAVNGALEVDLFGNVNAQKVGSEMYTGVGGQRDFMAGATHNADGRSIIALPSTAVVGQKRISRIRPELSGGIATTSMHDVKYVVTEFGVARLDGKNEVQRARSLIGIAHPDFRPELHRALAAQLAARRAAEARRYQKFLAEKSGSQEKSP